ncbi:MAG: hypothetical protein COA78_05730 [Blastopirellula sp.]|nr:MAG: hypothetical protein COA78_05730 [Blastopirellula sp.]
MRKDSPYNILYWFKLNEIGTSNDRSYWIYNNNSESALMKLRESFAADKWHVVRSRIFSEGLNEAFEHDTVIGNISEDDLNLLKQHHAADQPDENDNYRKPFLIPARLAVKKVMLGDDSPLDGLLDC